MNRAEIIRNRAGQMLSYMQDNLNLEGIVAYDDLEVETPLAEMRTVLQWNKGVHEILQEMVKIQESYVVANVLDLQALQAQDA